MTTGLNHTRNTVIIISGDSKKAQRKEVSSKGWSILIMQKKVV